MLATLWLARPAEASFIINFAQSGPNVVATGSGSINLSAFPTEFGDLVDSGPPFQGFVEPNSGALALSSSFDVDIYSGFIGEFPDLPALGPGGLYVAADSGTGPFVSFVSGGILVPVNYVSGAAMGPDSATWNNTTFAGLGLTPGTYLYSWGSGASADTLTVNIPSAAPEPGSMAFIAMGGSCLALLRRRKQA